MMFENNDLQWITFICRGSRADVTLMRALNFAGDEQCLRVHCVSRTRNAPRTIEVVRNSRLLNLSPR